MKKTTLLFVLIITFSSFTYAQTWCGDSYMTLNGTWYTGSNSYLQAAGYFQNANLGTFDKSTTSSITLGGELQVYPSIETDATMYYSFNGFTFNSFSLPKNGTYGNNSKHYGEKSINITGFSPGTYSVWVYFQAGNVYDSNNSANFKANFTITDTAAGIDHLESTLKLSGSNGTIKAIFDGEAQVELFTMTGQLIRSANVTNEFTQLVNSGAYLIRINGQSHKILVN